VRHWPQLSKLQAFQNTNDPDLWLKLHGNTLTIFESVSPDDNLAELGLGFQLTNSQTTAVKCDSITGFRLYTKETTSVFAWDVPRVKFVDGDGDELRYNDHNSSGHYPNDRYSSGHYPNDTTRPVTIPTTTTRPVTIQARRMPLHAPFKTVAACGVVVSAPCTFQHFLSDCTWVAASACQDVATLLVRLHVGGCECLSGCGHTSCCHCFVVFWVEMGR
jgi:hypothetical protein